MDLDDKECVSFNFFDAGSDALEKRVVFYLFVELVRWQRKMLLLRLNSKLSKRLRVLQWLIGGSSF